MVNLIAQIGEHRLLFHLEEGLLASWLRTKFNARQASGGDSALSRCDLAITVHAGYGAPFQGFAVHVSEQGGKVVYKRADYRVEAAPNYRSAIIAAYDPVSLEHALVNLYSAFIVHNGWGLLVHASCVAAHGKAYLFTGPSGAGKSTVALLSGPRPVLSDEASLLKVGDDGLTVFDSPFRSESQSEDPERRLPVCGIHLLVQSERVEKSAMSRSTALIELMRVVFFWAHRAEETAKLFVLCGRAVSMTPVYRLMFQKNDLFWECVQ